MRFLRVFILVLVPVLLIWSCSNDEPIFPLEPQIEVLSVTPDSLCNNFGIDGCGDEQNLTLTLSYTDGDGDLGSDDDQDTTNVNFFMQDLRENHPDNFDGIIVGTMPSLTAEARNPSIQGEIQFSLPVGLVNYNTDGSYDSTRFAIWITDRAGNQSNVDTSDWVYICPGACP